LVGDKERESSRAREEGGVNSWVGDERVINVVGLEMKRESTVRLEIKK
jgi:hypothetical protein